MKLERRECENFELWLMSYGKTGTYNHGIDS